MADVSQETGPTTISSLFIRLLLAGFRLRRDVASMLSLVNLVEQPRQAVRDRAAHAGIVHFGKAVTDCRCRWTITTTPGRLLSVAGHLLILCMKTQSMAAFVCSTRRCAFFGSNARTREQSFVATHC
jgi:hypothetical protein